MTRQLELLAELVRAESGVRSLQPHTLARALAQAAPGLDARSFVARAATDPELVARLLDEATVQETFFWRDANQLGTIDWRGLLAHAQARGAAAIEVWTAGCASGDEAYTLALQAIDALGTAPPVRILGTDLSRTALERAAAGVYRERSLRLVPRRLRVSAFEPGPRRTARVGDGARALVRFARNNLVRDPTPAPSTFDLVLCRNVLIYFDGETAAGVHDRLERAVAEGGTLLLGVADRLCVPVPEARPAPATRAPRRIPDEAEPLFADGLAQLVLGNAAAAVAVLRRALYVEPLHAAAAFQLGRAHEAAGDPAAARLAYGRALRALSEGPARDRLPVEVCARDIATACTHRIEALS